MAGRMVERARVIYREYPPAFWSLVAVTFIDRLGGALIFPFFGLYLTRRFGVGMTEVGMLFAAWSVSSLVGSSLGGALTDRIGRKRLLIFSLLSTSVGSVAMGLAGSLHGFLLTALVAGTLADTAGPAQQAMVADILPEEKRAQGYGILRVVFNLSVTLGPAIGGLLVARSYLLLFVVDALISLAVAGIVVVALPETRPHGAGGTSGESLVATFTGYLRPLRDHLFMAFHVGYILITFAYINLSTVLGVYLRDMHGVRESEYGLLITLNAVLVVLFQFPIARRIEHFPPMLMMTAGALLYALGFPLYGLAASYAVFALAMVVITLGEMLVAPVSQALVSSMAPEAMRGRYLAASGIIGWAFPSAVGPLLAGAIFDTTDPRLLWLLAGGVGLLGAGVFHRLYAVGKGVQLAR